FILLQVEDCIRDRNVTGVQTCALPIYQHRGPHRHHRHGAGERARAHHDPRPDPARAHGDLRPHRTPHPARWRWPMKRFRIAQDRGSATDELALLTTLLILIALLVILSQYYVSSVTVPDDATDIAVRVH